MCGCLCGSDEKKGGGYTQIPPDQINVEEIKPQPKKLIYKQQWDWGKDIIVTTPLINLIKVELPSPQKFKKHLDYKKITKSHIYLYAKRLGQKPPIEDIQSVKFEADRYILNFQPGDQVKYQEYEYVFAFEMNQSNEIIKVKTGLIKICGKITDVIFIKNDSNKIEKQLNKKVDQIKKNGHIINILILGRVSLGKSSYIANYTKMLNQLYEFQYQRLPQTAYASRTITQQFESYPLKYRNQNNKNECRINLVDGPGLGGQLTDMSTTEFSNKYCDALNLLLNGELDYKKFNISKQINLQAAKQEQDPNKIIHYCLVFVTPSDTKEMRQIITRVMDLIVKSQITYGLVINKSDENLSDNLPTPQSLKKISDDVLNEGYKMQGEDHIFSTCFSQKYFPKNQIFYEQFQRSVYFGLTHAIEQIQNNIVNIYLQQINSTQMLIQMVRIKNTITLQQFITSSTYFKKREINDINIKYQGKYRNLGGIIHDQDPDEKEAMNLLYYKSKVNNKWKIVFRIK